MTSERTSHLWKNRYEIDRELGRGGFGVVYLARDQQLLSKRVVIKVLQDESSPDPYFQKKFQQEIEALARLDHPGVVGVLDVGETPEGKPFLVMQFVEGVTLNAEIGKDGMSFSRAGHILRQVCQALGAAHDKGIFHRDLKPENIMLTRSSETEEYVKLIDFGIAAVRDSQVTAKGETSKIVGTPSYMAPEQMMGKGTSASDIYALGVIAFQMLTGQRPDVSPQGVAVTPRQIRPAIPEGAEALILKALSFQPESRPSKAREFGDQISRALGIPSVTPAPITTLSGVEPRSDSSANLEMAYILFMDIVAYSKLPMDMQSQSIQRLQEIVRGSSGFQRAQQADQIVSLPTGDGMALVFFQNPAAPVQCAAEISRSLKSFPEIQLRMGVHTGPVYRIADINTNRNVAGGGINLAQRVMDCGDAGHILLSKTMADILFQLSDWAPLLHDLGEAEVKHGVKVNVVNFYTSEVGNPAIPERIRTRLVPAAVPPSGPGTTAYPQARTSTLPKTGAIRPDDAAAGTGSKSAKHFLIAAAIAAVLVMAVVAAMQLGERQDAPPDATKDVPAAAPSQPIAAETSTASAPASAAPKESKTAAVPVRQASPEPPPIPPPPVPAAEPTPTPPAETPANAIPRGRGGNRGFPPAAGQREFAPARAGLPGTPQPPTGAFPQRGGGQRAAAMQQGHDRLLQLISRWTAAGRTLRGMQPPPGPQAARMRGEIANARQAVESSLSAAKNAMDARDPEAAARHMDTAEAAIQKVEALIRR